MHQFSRRRLATIAIAAVFLITLVAGPVSAIDKYCSSGYEVRMKSNFISGSIRYHHWHTYPGGAEHTLYYNYTGWAYTNTHDEDVTGALYGADGSVTGFSVYCQLAPMSAET